MSIGSEHGTLSDRHPAWFYQPSAPTAHMIPWASCSTTGFHQACAVPFRKKGKRLEFCLITSSAGRWVFPKGLIDPGDTPAVTARKEALEEAGLHGRLVGQPLGSYEAHKNGRVLLVVVMLMGVTRSDEDWEEAAWRQRRWVTQDGARQLLCQAELRDCLDAALVRLKA